MGEMKQSQKIVKNTAAGAVGILVGGFLQMGAMVYIARHLGVESFGVYSFALAFSMFFQLLLDTGINNILVREMARQPEKIEWILGVSMGMLRWFCLLIPVLTGLILLLIPGTWENKGLAFGMVLGSMVQLYSTGYRAVMLALERNDMNSINFVLHKIAFFICVVISLPLSWGLPGVVFAHLAANVAALVHFKKKVHGWGIRTSHIYDREFGRFLIGDLFASGGAAGMRLLAQEVDILLLSLLATPYLTGIYSGPYRLAIALRFVPVVLTVPLFPLFTRLAKERDKNPEAFVEAYERAFKILSIVILPGVVLLGFGAETFVVTLLGEGYRESVPIMRALCFAFFPYLLSNLFPYLLTALHDQKALLISSTVSVSVRIILTIVLLPSMGVLAPCIAFAVSEYLVIALWVIRLHKLGCPLSLFGLTLRPVMASCLMAIPLYFFPLSKIWMLIVAAPICGLLVIFFYCFSGTFSAQDIRLGKEGIQIFQEKFQKFRSAPVKS